jgi:hypothetical protein
LDWLLAHPRFTGLLLFILAAPAFAPRFSVIASWICLALASVSGVLLLGGISWFRRSGLRWILGSTLLVAVIALFGNWLTGAKTSENADLISQISKDLGTIKGMLSQQRTATPPRSVKTEPQKARPKQRTVPPVSRPAASPPSDAQRAASTPSTAKVLTLAEMLEKLEKERVEREAKEPPEPPCRGDNLRACGDKGLLEWGAPLVERVVALNDQISLDVRIATRYGGDKFIKAMDAIDNDVAIKYRQCCAADALKYYQELVLRLGGGLQDQDFYDWSAKLLSPIKSKEWKSAREEAQSRVSNLAYDLQTKTRELDSRLKKRRLGHY